MTLLGQQQTVRHEIVTDRVKALRDPRVCKYDARDLVNASGAGATRLTLGEAVAVNRIWGGARSGDPDTGEVSAACFVLIDLSNLAALA